jgi:hypothetical protein
MDRLEAEPATYRRLIRARIPSDLAGSIGADISDLREGLDLIEEMLTSLPQADSGARRDALLTAREECDLHLRGHMKSLSLALRRLMKIERT